MKTIETNTDQVPPAHPASTVILLRPASTGFEVLLLLRAKAVKFAGNAWVFPGGRIDPLDYSGGSDDLDTASKQAAARESSEEAGLNLDPEDFVQFSHWTTPVVEKKRFSTWFLISSLEEQQKVTVDHGEIVDYQWLSPQSALELHKQDKLNIMPPTYLSLIELSQHQKVSEAISFAKSRAQSRKVPHFFPKMIMNHKTPGILLEGDAGFETSNMDCQDNMHRITLSNRGWQYIHP